MLEVDERKLVLALEHLYMCGEETCLDSYESNRFVLKSSPYGGFGNEWHGYQIVTACPRRTLIDKLADCELPIKSSIGHAECKGWLLRFLEVATNHEFFLISVRVCFVEYQRQLQEFLKTGLVNGRLMNAPLNQKSPRPPGATLSPSAGDTERDESLIAGKSNTGKKAKKSTRRGEAQAKLTAALTKHHDYAGDSCLNQAPIGNNALAKLAETSPGSATKFFQDEFGGHSKYVLMCGDSTKLVCALKLLNQEFSPKHLAGGDLAEMADRNNGLNDDE